MKINAPGIIGGIGPESTIEYYRKIVTAYVRRQPEGNYPRIIINSIDMKKMLDLIGNRKFDEVSHYLATEIRKLENAGADMAVMASNTPHIVFNQVRELSPLPLLSIVDATCRKVKDTGLDKVALFGTAFTMQGGFYDDVLAKSGIEVITPEPEDQNFIHNKYMGELVRGVILEETRSGLIQIIDKMKVKHGIQGLILGGTEFPLILKAGDLDGVQVFDTTEIHVEGILDVMG